MEILSLVRITVSPSSIKIACLVSPRKDSVSLAIKLPLSPMPTTSGLSLRVATIFCGSTAEIARKA